MAIACLLGIASKAHGQGIADYQLRSSYSGVGSCAASNWVHSVSRNAAPSCTQPLFSDISGTATLSQLPGTGATTVNGQTCTLGSTCNVNVGAVSGTISINKGNGIAISGIDFPDVKTIPAANCNNGVAGAGWSLGAGGTVSCRAGTNNLGGFVSITDTSTTFATFQIPIPEDWDSGTNPYIRFQIASTDATNGHTIIPSIQVACYKGDGSTTDDVAANAAHSLSTTTLNGNANRFWSGSSVQMNSTDVTGCVAGALMQVTVGRATDTATNAEFYSATITFPRLLVVQAN